MVASRLDVRQKGKRNLTERKSFDSLRTTGRRGHGAPIEEGKDIMGKMVEIIQGAIHSRAVLSGLPGIRRYQTIRFFLTKVELTRNSCDFNYLIKHEEEHARAILRAAQLYL